MSHELRTSEELLLRPRQDDDADAVLQAIASPDMGRQTAVPVTDLSAARAWIAQMTAD